MIFSREILFLFAKNRLVSSAKRVNLKTFDDVYNNSFSSPETLLKISVSSTSFDTGCSGEDLVKAEALHCCSDKTWSSYLCMLDLSTVVNAPIQTFYPDFGFEKYKLFFNQTAHPRFFASCSDTFYILFCCSGTVINNETFNLYI